jgi:hypothetical protein
MPILPSESQAIICADLRFYAISRMVSHGSRQLHSGADNLTESHRIAFGTEVGPPLGIRVIGRVAAASAVNAGANLALALPCRATYAGHITNCISSP